MRKYLPDLTASEWQQVKENWEPRMVKKSERVLGEGQICQHLYFLETGLLRFHYQKDGEDITKFFTEPPYVFTARSSLTSQKPSKEGIEALMDSQMWQVGRERLERLRQLPIWQQFIYQLTSEVQGFTENILEELQTDSVELRYQHLLEHRPFLVKHAPLRHLASYLGIAPQSLSRIRKRMSQPARK
ncbi:MAG: Crp/Fnr family transcriptional regulator [Bacteroidota bacterium]